MKIVIACLNIIWECRYRNKLAFWGLENPLGYLRQFLGKPLFTFHPYEFGDFYQKRTEIWGYFNLPKKLKNKYEYLPNIIPKDHGHPTNRRKLPSISELTSSKEAARRAITPPGFAQAFYKANK